MGTASEKELPGQVLKGKLGCCITMTVKLLTRGCKSTLVSHKVLSDSGGRLHPKGTHTIPSINPQYLQWNYKPLLNQHLPESKGVAAGLPLAFSKNIRSFYTSKYFIRLLPRNDPVKPEGRYFSGLHNNPTRKNILLHPRKHLKTLALSSTLV